MRRTCPTDTPAPPSVIARREPVRELLGVEPGGAQGAGHVGVGEPRRGRSARCRPRSRPASPGTAAPIRSAPARPAGRGRPGPWPHRRRPPPRRPRSTVAVGGPTSPSSTDRIVDLPHPEGPTRAVTRPGRISNEAPATATRSPKRHAQVAHADGGRGRVHLPRPGRGRVRLEDLEHPLGRPHAVGGGVEVLADQPQRQVDLRGQDQHRQPGRELHGALDQAQADRHGDDRHRQRGQQLEHQRRQERDPQHAHGAAPGTGRRPPGSWRPGPWPG